MSEQGQSKIHAGSFVVSAEQGGHVDTVGVAILGVICLILLFAYMRAQGRNRKLTEKLARLEK